MKKLTNKEIELLQNAMLFFNEAEQIEDEKLYNSAYNKLSECSDKSPTVMNLEAVLINFKENGEFGQAIDKIRKLYGER